jgi:hypothetical protein
MVSFASDKRESPLNESYLFVIAVTRHMPKLWDIKVYFLPG